MSVDAYMLDTAETNVDSCGTLSFDDVDDDQLQLGMSSLFELEIEVP